MLSDAAQQEHLTHSDVRAAAAAATSTAPELKPPKPQKGCTGWVRRHLSLNVNAPWRAGKKGASMLGLRGCFKGAKGKEEEENKADSQPQGEQQYQSWMQ